MDEAAGYCPTVIEYLKTGWTKPQLQGLFAAAGLTPHTALREAKSPAAELGLLAPSADDETLLAAMVEHPVLVNRPIVCTAKGVRLSAQRDGAGSSRPFSADRHSRTAGSLIHELMHRLGIVHTTRHVEQGALARDQSQRQPYRRRLRCLHAGTRGRSRS